MKLFEMAAMPLPCNGILLIQGNLPRVFASLHLELCLLSDPLNIMLDKRK